MTSRKQSRPNPNRSRPGARGGGIGIGSFLLGVLVTACIVAGAIYYFHIHLPGLHPRTHGVAKTAPPHLSSGSDSHSSSEDKPKAAPLPPPPATAPRAPFPISEDVYEAGARLYVAAAPGTASCATCHGTPGRLGAKMPQLRPGAVQFFEPESPAAKSPSQLFVRTKYGVAGAPGMPAYAGSLTDTQIWQIALLLSNAGQTYPDPVNRIFAKHR